MHELVCDSRSTCMTRRYCKSVLAELELAAAVPRSGGQSTKCISECSGRGSGTQCVGLWLLPPGGPPAAGERQPGGPPQQGRHHHCQG